MLPVHSGGHTAYQDFVVTKLRKYYPNPDAISRSILDIIDLNEKRKTKYRARTFVSLVIIIYLVKKVYDIFGELLLFIQYFLINIRLSFSKKC